MPLYVLDNTKLYEADLDNMLEADRGNTVISGCSIAAHGVPDMGVRVAAGVLHALGASVTVAQTDITIAVSDPANTRIDLIHVDMTTGVPAVVAGTFGQLKPGSLPVNSILLGYVSVGVNAVNIQNSNITQRQLASSWRSTSGLRATRPAAGYRGRTWYSNDPDQPELERDNGTTWDSLTNRYQNLVLNSDFGRRTIFGLAMPEVFTDLAGWTKMDAGAAGSVAGNIFTQGAANNEYGCTGGTPFVWRDGRASATFKATNINGIYQLRWRIDANNQIILQQNVGFLFVSSVVAGVADNTTVVAQALTLNRWYWLELEKQGTTWIGKLYDTGGTVPGVAKPTTAPLQTLVKTVASANLQVGAHITISSDQAAAQWGGIAASPGGVYVETWLPESWAITFSGTLGGQAIGYDEVADAGPLGKQWALCGYIPAASRKITAQFQTAPGTVAPATTYQGSVYVKSSAYGGSGALMEATFYDCDVALGNAHAFMDFSATAQASWTRMSGPATASAATARRSFGNFAWNVSSTATGTLWVMLAQVEQGSVASAWHPAPADDAPIVWEGRSLLGTQSTTSAVMVEADSAGCAMNIHLPWDAMLVVSHECSVRNGVAGNITLVDVNVDGANVDDGIAEVTSPVAGYDVFVNASRRVAVAAGKHRVASVLRVTAGTTTWNDRPSRLIVTAYRGK